MRLSEKAKQLLEKHIQVMLNASGQSGSSGRWPMPVLKTTMDASIYSERFLAKAFYDRVQKLKNKGFTYRKIALLFDFPSTLARLTFLPRTRMIWPMSKEQQIEMYNDLAEILSYTYKTNLYVDEGKNIIANQKTVKEISTKILESGTPISNEMLSELDGRLWMYTEMIFSRWHNLGHEFHGPYFSNGSNLLIKEWHDLTGPGWEVFSNFPYNKITCFEFYNGNEITLDIHNRLNSIKPLSTTLTKSYVVINHKVVSSDEITNVIRTLDEYLSKGAEFLVSRNEGDLKKMNAVMEFYAIKPLADALHEDWHPPKEIDDNINKNHFSQKEESMLNMLRTYYQDVTLENLDFQYNPSRDFGLIEQI